MKKKKNELPWKDCLTLLSWEQVQQYTATKEKFTLEMVLHNEERELFTGEIVTLNPLSDNAFYFWFFGTYKGKPLAIKVKQNVNYPLQRYLDKIDVDAVRLYRIQTGSAA